MNHPEFRCTEMRLRAVQIANTHLATRSAIGVSPGREQVFYEIGYEVGEGWAANRMARFRPAPHGGRTGRKQDVLKPGMSLDRARSLGQDKNERGCAVKAAEYSFDGDCRAVPKPFCERTKRNG